MGVGREGGGPGRGLVVCLLVVLILFVAAVAAGGVVIGVLAYLKVEDLEKDSTSGVIVGLTGDSSVSQGDVSISHDSGEVWRFGINHYNNRVEYLDDAAGLIKGYNVDIVNAVCRIAGKNCLFIQDPYGHCWESPHGSDARGGIGLMGGYYDACTGWFVTKDRLRVFDFTDAFQQTRPSVFLVKTGNPSGFQHDDLSGKKVGFLETWAADEHCINTLSGISGTPLGQNQIFYYQTQQELEAAVNANDIDAAFVAEELGIVNNLEQSGPGLQGCLVDGTAIMTRKGSALPSWWNPAFKKLTSTREYEQICDDVADVHGHISGPEKEDLCL